MIPKKILVVYKVSVFEKQFKGSAILKRKNPPVIARHLEKTYSIHCDHYQSLQRICAVLRDSGFDFDLSERRNRIDLKPYDVIFTVGGDGTFMEVAHQIESRQLLVGINSAPESSVGRYCCVNVGNFEGLLQKLRAGRVKICSYTRLCLKVSGKIIADKILNDFLVAHSNPAMMSRYILKIGGREESQRSSGLWISTPSGSSGAIKSAGGKVISSHKKSMVYLPREMHQALMGKYVLKGGVVPAGKKIVLTSMMKDGMIYGDGSNVIVPFPYSMTVEVGFSGQPLKTLQKDVM